MTSCAKAELKTARQKTPTIKFLTLTKLFIQGRCLSNAFLDKLTSSASSKSKPRKRIFHIFDHDFYTTYQESCSANWWP